MTDKITRIVHRVLREDTVPPAWDDSRLSNILRVLPATYNEQLAGTVVRRSLQFKREYGMEGDVDFQVLLDFYYLREDALCKVWRKRSTTSPGISRRLYGALTDTCAVLSLTSKGIRVGDHWINMFEKFKSSQRHTT